MDHKEISKVLLQKKNMVFLPDTKNTEEYSPVYAISLIRNIESLGFTASLSLFNALMLYSPLELKDISDELVENLKEIISADVEYKPLYANFPESVIEEDIAELTRKQVLSYMADEMQIKTGFDYRKMIDFDGEKKDRDSLESDSSFTLLTVGCFEDFIELSQNILKAKSSISEYDKSWLEPAIISFPDVIPDTINNKEVLGFVSSVVLNNDLSVAVPFSTATDVLRMAVSLSKGDVSLSQKPKFKNFSRKERRFLLSSFDFVFSKNKHAVEELVARKGWYERLCEKIHPQEYKLRYPTAAKVFLSLRANKKIMTHSSRLESALLSEDIDEAIRLLKMKPGVFARKLDHILRIAEKHGRAKDVLNAFRDIAVQVDTPVLWSVKNHFDNRRNDRVAIPKGQLASSYEFEQEGYELSEETAKEASAISISAIRNIYSEKETMEGKNVYIDDSIKGYTVPSALRSTSRSFKTVGRGSRVQVNPDSGCLRAFVYWKGNGVDLDLAANFLDKDFCRLGNSVDYMTLKTNFACHSGDITSAPYGDSEFVDVSLPLLEKEFDKKCKYIAFVVYSYSCHSFSDLETAFFGLMERKAMNNRGEIYEPKTVKFKFDLTAKATISIPLVFDVETREFIWADMPFKEKHGFPNNSENNKSSLHASLKGLVESPRISIYDVIFENCVQRNATLKDAPVWEETIDVVTKNEDGEDVIVQETVTKKADLVISLDGDVSPYDSDKILGEWL